MNILTSLLAASLIPKFLQASNKDPRNGTALGGIIQRLHLPASMTVFTQAHGMLHHVHVRHLLFQHRPQTASLEIPCLAPSLSCTDDTIASLAEKKAVFCCVSAIWLDLFPSSVQLGKRTCAGVSCAFGACCHPPPWTSPSGCTPSPPRSAAWPTWLRTCCGEHCPVHVSSASHSTTDQTTHVHHSWKLCRPRDHVCAILTARVSGTRTPSSTHVCHCFSQTQSGHIHHTQPLARFEPVDIG